MTSMPNLYQRLVTAHGPSPMVTCYTAEGRVEVSGRVLGNWVAKASSMLVEDCDVQAGDRIALHLPAHHWRATYWAVAAWSVGASVAIAGPERRVHDAALVLTHQPEWWLNVVPAEQVVAVSLDLLPRPLSDCPVLQEAGTIGTHPDSLTFWEGLPADGLVLSTATQGLSWDDIVAQAGTLAQDRRMLAGDTTALEVIAATAAAIASTGSVVLTHSTDPAELQRIAEAERATSMTRGAGHFDDARSGPLR